MAPSNSQTAPPKKTENCVLTKNPSILKSVMTTSLLLLPKCAVYICIKG